MTRKTCYKELGAIFVEEVLLKRQGDSNPYCCLHYKLASIQVFCIQNCLLRTNPMPSVVIVATLYT